MGPFRNPAIAKVFAEAFVGDNFTDPYGSKIYFRLQAPSTMIAPTRAAVRYVCVNVCQGLRPFADPRCFR